MKKPIDLYKIGEKIEFNDAREQTNGKRTEGTVTLAPGKFGPPPHRHMLQEEGFELISGSMIVKANGRETVLKPGDVVIVQPGEAHTFRNGSDTEEMVARAWFEPALNIEWMLQTMGEDAMANGGDWKNVSLLPAMYIMWKARKEYRIAGFPFLLQDIIFGIGAAIARLTGAHKKVDLPKGLA